MALRDSHKIVAVFHVFSVSSFSISLSRPPMFLLISCCFIPSWNPPTAHHMRLQAYLCTLVIKMITCNFFVLGNYFPEKYNYNFIFESLAELILEKCNSSWGKSSDYNYISELQEELILSKLHFQLHFLIGGSFVTYSWSFFNYS